MSLILADGVGNLRDPRVGNIMTLDTPSNSELLDRKLAQEGVPHQYVSIDNMDGHIMEEWQSERV